MADLDTNQRTVFTKLAWGLKVEKEDAIVSANDDLFTVVGKVVINLMYGIVTTAISGGASTLELNETVSGIAIVAQTTITGDGLNTLYLVTGHPDVAFNGALTPTVAVATATAQHDSLTDRSPAHAPLIFNGGASGLIIESTESGDRAGAITWTIFYSPMEGGAYIKAAA